MIGMSEQVYTPTNTCIETYSGLYFDYANPTIEQIDIIDIAHGLSNVCRFAGHSQQFYSVAQHSVLVSQYAPSLFALEALLHDASEAYLGDIPRPLKHMPYFAQYRALEDLVMILIAKKYGFTLPLSPSIKLADERMLCTEKRDLMGPDEWNFGVEPYPDKIVPMVSSVAEQFFLNRFYELTNA